GELARVAFHEGAAEALERRLAHAAVVRGAEFEERVVDLGAGVVPEQGHGPMLDVARVLARIAGERDEHGGRSFVADGLGRRLEVELAPGEDGDHRLALADHDGGALRARGGEGEEEDDEGSHGAPPITTCERTIACSLEISCWTARKASPYIGVQNKKL